VQAGESDLTIKAKSPQFLGPSRKYCSAYGIHHEAKREDRKQNKPGN